MSLLSPTRLQGLSSSTSRPVSDLSPHHAVSLGSQHVAATSMFLESTHPIPTSISAPTSTREGASKWQHLYILPVLLLEFLALATTRAVLPSLLLQNFGNRVYLVMGFADCIRGLLAFLASPLFGKISDVVGRRMCLFVTVLGTCAPVCSLAFFSWDVPPRIDSWNEATNTSNLLLLHADSNSGPDETSDQSAVWPLVQATTLDTAMDHNVALEPTLHRNAIGLFVVLLALSGMFSSTFTLVFAYISDTVKNQEERVTGYGLALATFGLSFTIGPMAGGYLAQSNKQYVFIGSLLLTILDLLYIYLILPESRLLPPRSYGGTGDRAGSSTASIASFVTLDHKFSWNPWDTFQIVIYDPLLWKVGQVALFYYTGLWALISTLSVYAVKRFHLSPERLGELMSVLGLCTMVAEAVLVRILVPLLGEKRSMKLGLASFGLQCIVLAFAYDGWHLFICAAFSLLGNLVYPSLSSLVSGSVEPDEVGEALGAINGIKALTEGIGPLVFGGLMTISEHSSLPGWPYLLAACLVAIAYRVAGDLPDPEEDDYIHEVDRRRRRWKDRSRGGGGPSVVELRRLPKSMQEQDIDSDYEGLLSEVDESEEE